MWWHLKALWQLLGFSSVGTNFVPFKKPCRLGTVEECSCHKEWALFCVTLPYSKTWTCQMALLSVADMVQVRKQGSGHKLVVSIPCDEVGRGLIIKASSQSWINELLGVLISQWCQCIYLLKNTTNSGQETMSECYCPQMKTGEISPRPRLFCGGRGRQDSFGPKPQVWVMLSAHPCSSPMLRSVTS